MAEGSHASLGNFQLIDEVGYGNDWDDSPFLHRPPSPIRRPRPGNDVWDIPGMSTPENPFLQLTPSSSVTTNRRIAPPIPPRPQETPPVPPRPSFNTVGTPSTRPSTRHNPFTTTPQVPPRPITQKVSFQKADKYDGTTPLRQYLAHFKAVQAVNHWSDAETACQLAASLRGSACRVLYPKPVDSNGMERPFTLIELVHRLQRRYGPGEMAANYLSLLKQRTQQPQESLQELSEEIRELSLKAYPEASWKFLDRLSVTHFMDAILNAEVREAVHRSKSTTLDDALSAALEAENWRKA